MHFYSREFISVRFLVELQKWVTGVVGGRKKIVGNHRVDGYAPFALNEVSLVRSEFFDEYCVWRVNNSTGRNAMQFISPVMFASLVTRYFKKKLYRHGFIFFYGGYLLFYDERRIEEVCSTFSNVRNLQQRKDCNHLLHYQSIAFEVVSCGDGSVV